jgi:ribose-phosphate pyrophosphokinase
LAGFEVFANDLKGDDCVIVDDICDGGRTFIGIAQELKMKNAGDIYLCVSHGIFSHGFDELRKYFKKIFTTNSFKDINDEIVKQIEIKL